MVGNVGWAAAHFILPFKNDFLFPVFLVKMVPEIVSDADSRSSSKWLAQASLAVAVQLLHHL